jgi:hypothetical protein
MLAVSDQKKCTLVVLRQQHAAAKAKKLQDEQLKSQKKAMSIHLRPSLIHQEKENPLS